jgi:HAD superfamily hydrolase (TIGR01484 family)
MKKVIAFDLDDTLAVSKSKISDKMSELLGELIKNYQVCIISGGAYHQFKTQVIDHLHIEHHYLQNLHVMPTCGTRYYRYEDTTKEWKVIYAEDLSEEDRKKIIKTVEEAARKMDLWTDNPYGEIIEDRLSQISISMLGQKAPAEEKYAWYEKNNEKRLKLREAISEKLPEYEVRAGGTTTIDITKSGIDKAYGMEKLMQELEVSKEEILFVGDKLDEGGNDYPVKALGIDTIAVEGWEDTALVVETINKLSK